MGLEVETKLQLHANAQLKFSSRTTQCILERKIRALCSALNISVGDRSEELVEDHYYDDEARTFRKAGLSLRLRRKGEQFLLSFKSDSQNKHAGSILLRNEFEQVITKLALPSHTEILAIIQTTFQQNLNPGPLKQILTIQNNRTNLPLVSSSSQATLSCDRFYYSRDGTFSDTMFLIEIESGSGYASFQQDNALLTLRTLLGEVLDCMPIHDSKLDAGIQWVNDPITTKTVHTVIFDIISYSKLSIPDQKRTIQQLNHHTKQALVEAFGDATSSLVYIPTGDGMLIVFERHPEKIIPFLVFLQQRTKRTVGAAAFRCGLHTGQVFTYSDINDNLNFAGDGINTAQRVMALGGQFHILATHSAYESMGRINPITQGYFHDVGSHQVKHDVSLRIFNVYARDLEFGNPELIPNP
ncbi:MAG: CYTH domain-containing protein [Candidatus Taylorbacteria bacterium]